MSKQFFDIKRPGEKAPTPRIVRVPQNLPPLPMLRSKMARRVGGALITLVSVIVIVSLFGAQAARFKEQAVASAPGIYGNFQEGAKALFGFDLEKARAAFGSANQSVASLNSQAPLSIVPGILGDLFQMSQGAVDISASLADLQQNGLSLLLGKKGDQLIAKLRAIQDRLAGLTTVSGALQEQTAKLGYGPGAEISGMLGKIDETDHFMASLLNWLDSKKKERLLVLFQNPSEMRPAGGFIGSYGVATLFEGNLLDLSVRDIYDPDGQLDLKVVPPKPLQGITDTWGARDANWFFDFPTSARKVISFLEASKIYREQNITFSGAVAINVEMLKDILEVTGPIALPDYHLTITAANVLPELQKEVEAGKDKQKGEPKRILKVLTPIIFEKLGAMQAEQKQALFQKFTKRFSGKDIMAYFKDPALEQFLKNTGAAGAVSEISNDFFGDYLAVVHASVAGGKSDAVTDTAAKLTGTFEIDGRIHDHLTITKTHHGDTETEWWYRSTNHDYLQVYVPDGAKLARIGGATAKTVVPLISYAGKNFTTDADLAAVESGNSAFGKTVFPAWLDTPSGTSRTVSFDYYSPYRFNFTPGKYEMLIDKQSGDKGTLEVELRAPKGFLWQESGSPVFTASLKDLPARTMLTATLVEAPR